MTEKFKQFLREWLINNHYVNPNLEIYIKDCDCLYDFGADSLDEVMFVIELEREYGITINDKELDKLSILKMPFKYLSEYLEDKLRKKYEIK